MSAMTQEIAEPAHRHQIQPPRCVGSVRKQQLRAAGTRVEQGHIGVWEKAREEGLVGRQAGLGRGVGPATWVT